MPKKQTDDWPKITIITPSFNQGMYLEHTIKSVVGQNYPNLEYFILDGGSTDNSVKIIKKYARRYPQIIKWRSHPDTGQIAALNEGLTRARGKIIAYLNSDDYYLDRSLFNAANHFLTHPKTHWAYGNCKVTSGQLQWSFIYKKLWPVDRIPQLLYLLNPINQPAVFLSKTLTEKVGKFNAKYHYAFDYDYWLRCCKFIAPTYMPQCLAVFRIHQSAKSTQGFSKQFDEELVILRRQQVSAAWQNLHRFHNLGIKFVYFLLKK